MSPGLLALRSMAVEEEGRQSHDKIEKGKKREKREREKKRLTHPTKEVSSTFGASASICLCFSFWKSMTTSSPAKASATRSLCLNIAGLEGIRSPCTLSPFGAAKVTLFFSIAFSTLGALATVGGREVSSRTISTRSSSAISSCFVPFPFAFLSDWTALSADVEFDTWLRFRDGPEVDVAADSQGLDSGDGDLGRVRAGCLPTEDV